MNPEIGDALPRSSRLDSQQTWLQGYALAGLLRSYVAADGLPPAAIPLKPSPAAILLAARVVGGVAAFFFAGAARHLEGDLDGAEAEYARALNGREEVHVMLARQLIEETRGDSEFYLASASAIEPTNPWALALRGRRLRREGELERAADFLRAATTAQPAEPHHWVERANTSDDLGDVATALDQYNRAIDREPDYAPAFLQRGIAFRLQGERAETPEAAQHFYRAATEDFLAAARLDEACSAAHAACAYVSLLVDDPAKTLAAAQEAIAIDAGNERLHRGDRREQTWSDEQVASFLKSAQEPLQRALILALETGQRQGDLLRLTWGALDGGIIRLRQAKTQARVAIPVSPLLKVALEAAPRSESTLILTRGDGRPWESKGNGFRAAWRDACRRAGVSGVTFHDLRGTFVTRRLAAGWTTQEVAMCTGHSLRDLASLDTYADRGAVSEAVATRLAKVAEGAEREQILQTALQTGRGAKS